jgi:tRNA pseudouridine38-40 synthase
MRLALIVEYEGTDYCGFQYQVNASSVQEELEKAITSFTGEKVRVKAAGRTDAGVHAKGQVVAFDTGATHSPKTSLKALNHYLPDNVAVRAVYRVDEHFDPRRDAISRHYRYTILNSAAPSPLMRRTTFQVTGPLDAEKMDKASGLLEGTHDFARFSAMSGVQSVSTKRHIYRASVKRQGDIVAFDVIGSSFLYKQVRCLADSLVSVGRGNISLDEYESMIDGPAGEGKSRPLPANGLCLLEVKYAEFPPELGEFDGGE